MEHENFLRKKHGFLPSQKDRLGNHCAENGGSLTSFKDKNGSQHIRLLFSDGINRNVEVIKTEDGFRLVAGDIKKNFIVFNKLMKYLEKEL
jgi:hypothetical protein